MLAKTRPEQSHWALISRRVGTLSRANPNVVRSAVSSNPHTTMPKLHLERSGAIAFVKIDNQIISVHLKSAGVVVVVENNVAIIVAGNSQINANRPALSEC